MVFLDKKSLHHQSALLLHQQRPSSTICARLTIICGAIWWLHVADFFSFAPKFSCFSASFPDEANEEGAMNANQIVNMVVRMVLRKLVRSGVNAGMNAVGNRVNRGGKKSEFDRDAGDSGRGA